MNPQRHFTINPQMNVPKLTAICFLFFALLLVCGCARKYFSKATFEFKGSNAESLFHSQLPKDDSSVTLKKIPDTDLYEVGVYSTDPEVAARRANDLVINIQDAVKADGNAIKIWEIAEPATKPTWW
jgi:hypothetical protein